MNVFNTLKKHIEGLTPELTIKVKRPAMAYETAREHFRPVLNGPDAPEPNFIFSKDDTGETSASLQTFIGWFGDFVEADNYHRSAYEKRNKDYDLRIEQEVFDQWQAAGCLLWD
jgi:hypothetical protein